MPDVESNLAELMVYIGLQVNLHHYVSERYCTTKNVELCYIFRSNETTDEKKKFCDSLIEFPIQDLCLMSVTGNIPVPYRRLTVLTAEGLLLAH